MKKTSKATWKLAMSAIMIFVYVAIALIIAFSSLFQHISEIGRYGMSLILFFYGVLRAYRLWKDLN